MMQKVTAPTAAGLFRRSSKTPGRSTTEGHAAGRPFNARLEWSSMFRSFVLMLCLARRAGAQTDSGWMNLFDGRSMNGWKAAETSPRGRS